MVTYSQNAKREGKREFNDGNYTEAAASFRNAIHQNPRDPESQYWLGMSYEAGKDMHQAIGAYKTALQLMPHPNTPYYSEELRHDAFDRLAQVVASVDNCNEEIDLLQKEATGEQASEWHRLAGRVFRLRGDADSAIDEYRSALNFDRGNFAAQKELGIYLEQLRQNQAAALALRDAYRLNANDAEVNAALRRIGMVPGPSLLASEQLSKPFFNEPGAAPAADRTGPAPAGSPSRE
jgi:Flp pilus assembly protein TadD